MTREELEKTMGNEPKIQASFEVIGDDVKFIKLIVNGKENIVSVEELENTLSEPCDCISREEVCDYIAEFVNHEYATDREREMVKNIIGGIQHLPSIQPKPKTDVLDKIRAEIKAISIVGQVNEHTSFIRTGEHVKQMALDIIDKYTEEEIWEGIHAQVTAPKGTFDKIWNEAEDNDEI